MIGKDEAKKTLDLIEGGSEWTLLHLDENEGRALVLSKDCVAQMPYNEQGEPVTWQTCTLRKWLNGEFLNNLPEDFRSKAIQTEIINTNICAIPAGNNTKDFVFLLSIDEYNTLLPESLRAARFNGAASFWWLRSPGYSSGDVANVYPDGGLDGGISAHGFYAFCTRGGVRPALFLRL
jgi:hypothetical protein